MILEFRNDGEQSLQLHGVQAVQEEAFVIMEDAPLLGNTRHHQDDLSQQFGMKFLNPPSSSPSQFLGSETHEEPSQGWSLPQWRWVQERSARSSRLHSMSQHQAVTVWPW